MALPAGDAATGIFIATALVQGLAICAFLLGLRSFLPPTMTSQQSPRHNQRHEKVPKQPQPCGHFKRYPWPWQSAQRRTEMTGKPVCFVMPAVHRRTAREKTD